MSSKFLVFMDWLAHKRFLGFGHLHKLRLFASINGLTKSLITATNSILTAVYHNEDVRYLVSKLGAVLLGNHGTPHGPTG